MKKVNVNCFFGINRDNNTNESVLEITDSSSRKKIMEISFTPIEITQLLGRMAGINGNATVAGIEDLKNIGKTRVNDIIEVPVVSKNGVDRKDIAIEKAKKLLKNSDFNWEISDYFGSKDSFFFKEGQQYARVRISRYENK